MNRKLTPFDALGDTAGRQAEQLQKLAEQQRRLEDLMGPAYTAMRHMESVAATQRQLMQVGLDRAALESMDAVRRAMEASALTKLSDLVRAREMAIGRLPLAMEAAIQQERLYSRLRAFDRMATQSVAQYMQSLAVQQQDYSRLFASTVTSALGSWQAAIGSDVVADVQKRLVEQANAEPQKPIQEIVAHAVASALEQRDKRVDVRFVAEIVLAVLMMLVALLDSNQQQKQLQSIQQTVMQIEAELSKQQSLFDLLLTREVVRRTPMRSRPSSHSKTLALIEPGTTVIVFQRHGKWTRIGLASGAGPEASTSGWMLNKYLK
jgi:hypothetical protein